MSSESNRRIALPLLELACLAPLVVALSLVASPKLYPSLALDGTQWQLVVDTVSNAVFAWLPHPLEESGHYYSPKAVLSSLGLFALGLTSLLTSLYPHRAIEAFSAAVGCVLLLLTILGLDAHLLYAISVLPAAMYFLNRYAHAESTSALSLSCLGLGLSGLALAISAVQLGPLVAVLALLLVSAVSTTARLRRHFLSFGLLALPSVVLLFSTPAPQLPEYPLLAHVVPDDNLPGHIGALIGPSTALPIIDRDSLKSALELPLLVAVLLALSLALCQGLSPRLSKVYLSALGLLFLVALDVLFPESVAQLGPLATLGRLVPGLFFIPLAPIFLAVALTAVGVAFFEQRKSPLVHLFTLGVLGASILVVAPAATDGEKLRAGLVYQATTLHPQMAQAISISSQQQRSQDTPQQSFPVRARLVSPSFRLLNEYGLRPLQEPELFQNPQYISPLLTPAVTAWTNQDEVGNLFDGRDDTRWSAGAPSQRGGEWLHLYFEEAVELAGIELATGAWRWDFPRGLELRYLSSCPSAEYHQQHLGAYQTLLPAHSWQGKVEFTPDQFPYYGGQDHVQLIFPENATVQCLMIRQTQSHPHFQWSVAELRLLYGVQR